MDLTILNVYSAGFLAAFISAIIIALTQKLHGSLTLDSSEGVQKFHSTPTSRIGGIAILAGYITAWFFLEGEVQRLWGLVGLAGIPALAFGLGEDISGKVGVRARLMASFLAGLIFSLSTGYTITSLQLPGLDWLLTFSLFSLAFSAFAIGGVTNAINMIDGFHGLASGTVILVLAAIALAASRVGDSVLVAFSMSMATVVLGFFVVNFPFGKIFFGDAGAYFCGFVVAVLAVMLPARNPEISPWVSLLILGYPVTEAMVSIVRRVREKGHHPGAPDSAHLHHVIYKSWATMIANKLAWAGSANPLASVLTLSLPIFTLIAVGFVSLQMLDSVLMLGATIAIYIIIYRVLAPRGVKDTAPTTPANQK